jgi:membrane-bound lytic murein transglycosylase D
MGTVRVLVVLGAASGLAACASKTVQLTPPPSPPPLAASAEDPIARLIAAADSHLATALAQSKAGHLIHALEEFDRALELYLNAPGGALSHPRLAEAYRRTLETIQLEEFEALAEGDGFSEPPAERAAIDDMADLPFAANVLTEEARQAAEEAVDAADNDLSIQINDAVLSCIELYQGPLREWFAEALVRGGRYLPRIRDVFAEEGIPQDLAYVALVESAFKPAALSRAKAKGVWQFMPATGRQFGLQQDWWVDERSNPEKATRAAARYLKALYEDFRDWNLALAAYNAGPGRLRRSLNRNATGDFWELVGRAALPRETRNYVPMIHAAIVVAKAPDRYGFEILPEDPLSFDTVPVRGAVDLRLVAECAGERVAHLQTLNPELRRLATPAGRTFLVRVPPGRGAPTAECLSAVPPEKRVTFRTHVVARGQTLASIARKYGSRVGDIAQANGLRSPQRLRRGTELIIPVSPRAVSTVRQARGREAGTEMSSEKPGTVRIRYRVRPGDTLAAIASRYGTTVERLKSWNNLRGTRIAAGNTLTVYTRAD